MPLPTRLIFPKPLLAVHWMATVEAVKIALKKGDMVTLVGFGSFYVGERAARTGRNPRTGDTIKIKAAKVPKFRAGKGLKDAINKNKIAFVFGKIHK